MGGGEGSGVIEVQKGLPCRRATSEGTTLWTQSLRPTAIAASFGLALSGVESPTLPLPRNGAQQLGGAISSKTTIWNARSAVGQRRRETSRDGALCIQYSAKTGHYSRKERKVL